MGTTNKFMIFLIFTLIFISCSKNPADTGGNSKISGRMVSSIAGQLMLGEINPGNKVDFHRKVAIEQLSSNGEFEFYEIKNGNYSLIFFPDNHMPIVVDTVLAIDKEGNYEGIDVNVKILDFPKQIDTIFTIQSSANLDIMLGPVQVRVDEFSSAGLAYLNLYIKNEMPAKANFRLEFKYPSQLIAFDEILHLLELSIYDGSELFDRVVLNNLEEPLNPGDTLIYETYLTIPAIDNSSTYKVKCRLWGNYE